MLPSKQSRALQLMAGGFHLPTSASFFPNSQLRVTTHPSPSRGKGGAAAPHHPGGSLAGRQQSGEEREPWEEPWPGPALSPKGRAWNVGHLSPSFQTHPHLKQKASQNPFPLGGSSVHSHLCKCDGQDGAESKVNCPQWRLWLWPTRRVCAVGTGTPWSGATSPGDRLLGAQLRKACSSSSWRTRRSYP